MDSGSTARHLQILNFPALMDYIDGLLGEIRRPLSACEIGLDASKPEDVADKIFRIISNRRYCYLSRKRSAEYRESLVKAFAKAISANEPIRLYYDIGGGYHAGIDPGDLSPNFAPGLGETLIVKQISLLAQEIFSVYSHGVQFTLVIDNLCALIVNDVPLKNTEAFVGKLREMIQRLGSPVAIDLLVESEHFSADDYVRDSEIRPLKIVVDARAIDNVSRFLGRPCSAREASRRIAAYEHISVQTDHKINSLIDGIRMTQRATPQTFPFRPFPGSASRIQAGEVVLVVDDNGKCKPSLITTQNYGSLHLIELDLGPQISGSPETILVGVTA